MGRKFAGGLTTKDFELGVPPDIADRQFKQVIIHTPFTKCKIPANKAFVATIEREKLGSYLAKEDRVNNVKILTNTEVESLDKNSLKIANGLEIQFDYLIGADGSQSIVRKYLGLENDKLLIAFHYKVPVHYKKMEMFFDANLFGSAYAWIFPHKIFTSIGSGIDPKFYPGPDGIQSNFKKWAGKRSIELRSEWHESWMINYDYRGFQFDNFYLVGDAGGFADGFTGEGIYFAMVSGSEIAKKIINPDYQTPKLKEILAIKKDHENLLDFLRKNRLLTQSLYALGGLVFKTHLFDKRIIKSFS